MVKVINNDISIELLRKNETSANFLNDRIDEIIMEEYENESEGRLQDTQAQNLELNELVKDLQNRVFEAEKDVSQKAFFNFFRKRVSHFVSISLRRI